jgi:hypothetical protein
MSWMLRALTTAGTEELTSNRKVEETLVLFPEQDQISRYYCSALRQASTLPCPRTALVSNRVEGVGSSQKNGNGRRPSFRIEGCWRTYRHSTLGMCRKPRKNSIGRAMNISAIAQFMGENSRLFWRGCPPRGYSRAEGRAKLARLCPYLPSRTKKNRLYTNRNGLLKLGNLEVNGLSH